MRLPVRFEPAAVPATAPVTKLGGRPDWLTGPEWPLSATLGEPMTFIGQFRVDDGDEPRLAYVFMSDDDADGTWEPESGENAVVVQPGAGAPPFVTAAPLAEGPSLPETDHLPVEDPLADDEVPWQFLGGEPVWLQGDETPGAGWRLVGQITDAMGHNFGDAGIAYVFVSPDGTEGRFLWQCG